MIRKLIVGLCLLLPTLSNSQIIQHNISDDGYARVPLQFPFPYHGRVFTESFMFSNGVVGFLNPTNSWCCTGFNLETSVGSPFDFAIMPLQTDLLNYSGRFLTEGTAQYQRYKWENISEFGAPQNLNTFGVEIRPSGYIGMHYEKVNISPGRPVTIGRTGDTSAGEYTQYYHGGGFSSNEIVSYITQSTGDRCLVDPLSSIGCPGYAQAYLTQQCTINPLYDSSCNGYQVAYNDQQCALNSLYNSSCPGYATAYKAQQCSLNTLYSVDCPGYEQAYFNQQCSLNTLYNVRCTGYAEAYQAQQCSLNSLYSTSCPNYAKAYHDQQCSLNHLYATTCPGYEAAYFNQQCSLNPLYNSGCQGYETAYFTYQCTQSSLYNSRCPGYEQAYLAQQCGISQLYSASCPNYQQAYFNQQCTQNALYDTRCTGYAQAYFNQQCSNNSLYDRRCPGYNEAYALANIVPAPRTVVSAPVLQVSTTGTVSIETPVVSDPVVNEVITRPVNVSTPVQQNNTQPATEVAKAEPKAEKKTEAKPVARQTRAEAKNEVTQTAPVIVDIPQPIQPVLIVDLMYKKLVKKPIQDNNRAYYALIMGSQKSHEDMIDEQYRR